jgi:nicotinamidase-related amidase
MQSNTSSEKMLNEASQPFFGWLEGWLEGLAVMPIDEAIPDPRKAAVISVDVTNGFCYEGALSSPRVAGIVEPIARLFEQAWEHGVRNIVLSQDTHEPDAVEFAQWPPHCVRGTSEAESVDAFKRLPFFDQMVISEKNSVAPGLNTDLYPWLEAHPEVDTFIVTGDCTDLCTYQLAMFLRLDANARQIQRRIIVPANCVQTYDRPVEVAQEQGGLPHPGDLMHAIFLYHMQLNGMEVVAEIA